jgi:hypothetical protein
MEGVTFADLTEAERMLWEASRAAHVSIHGAL